MIAETAVEFKVDGVRDRLVNLEQWLVRAAEQGTGEHEVERHLFQEMLALGAQLLGAFFKLVGPGDLGEEVVLEGGQTVKRWPAQCERRLLTVFGEFCLLRWVYGTRPGQKIELVPTEQRLQLPEGDLSYLLQEWDQLLGTEQAFGLVRETLETVLGLRNRSIRSNAVAARWPRRPRPSVVNANQWVWERPEPLFDNVRRLRCWERKLRLWFTGLQCLGEGQRLRAGLGRRSRIADLRADLRTLSLTRTQPSPPHWRFSAHTRRPSSTFISRPRWARRRTGTYGIGSTGTTTIGAGGAAPSAADHTYNFTPGTPLLITAAELLAGSSDPDGDSLVAALAASPVYGTVTVNADGSVLYTPGATGRESPTLSLIKLATATAARPLLPSRWCQYRGCGAGNRHRRRLKGP